MESIGHPAVWVAFVLFVLGMLALDLGVFNRKSHIVSVKEATAWSLVWVGLSLLFGLGMFIFSGTDSGVEFLTGYVIEKSLSIDNIFVFVIIFQRMKIPPELQHRVLFWGVLGAIVLRAIMIFAGATLLSHFHWLIYLFGAFLVWTGFRIFREWQKKDDDVEETETAIMRFTKRIIHTTPELHGDHFFAKQTVKGVVRRVATPLFLTLILVELSDVVFALDSIPAIFAITLDPFIVFTSNIFAIMGLRSLYFLLGPMLDKFVYLKVGLSGVLAFVGLKMILSSVVHVPPPLSLLIIAAIIGVSVWLSIRHASRVTAAPPAVEGPKG